jgi:hypothetical protein
MKKTWIVGGILFISGAASAQTYQFSTVINQGDPLGSDAFLNSGQVVTDNQGNVGILATTEGLDFDIVYASNTGSGWNSSVVLDEDNSTGASINGVNFLTPTQNASNYQIFDNLAITGSALDPNLTFAAQLDDPSVGNPGDWGIVQYNSLTGTLNEVAFDHDTRGYAQVGNDGNDAIGGSIEMQVNGSNHVLFPAVNSSSQNVIVYGNPALLTNVFTSNPSGLTNAPFSDYRVGVGADGTSAATLKNGATSDVYLIPSNPPGGAPLPVALPAGNVPSNYVNPIIGYTSGVNGMSQAAVIAVDDTNHPGKEDLLLTGPGGTAHSILPQEFSASPGTTMYGQLDPNGQFAAYIPGTSSGNTIQYANLAVANSVTQTIATEAPTTGAVPTAVAQGPGGYKLDIISLQNPAKTWNPNVNSNGAVVFPAVVGTSPTDTSSQDEAICLWQPGDTNPQIVLSGSASDLATPTDQVNIEGYPAIINDFNWNVLGSESDYYKSSLSDNYLALDVDYTYTDDPNNPNAGVSGNAVIITSLSVPEPASVALIGIAATGLLARRRRA